MYLHETKERNKQRQTVSEKVSVRVKEWMNGWAPERYNVGNERFSRVPQSFLSSPHDNGGGNNVRTILVATRDCRGYAHCSLMGIKPWYAGCRP
ncbi:hypothetical protein GWI33_004156 [Rhynchophorus ferrugineus]|uniref:Uncharacterized protein n=1 Tax=Rhynchophorus ferrugineus TaxID=354439 RepID=A0A834M2J9_RHYFE|nr:hypothetical protein GWI33_004156 [Rhynchophorus ferrugineus]